MKAICTGTLLACLLTGSAGALAGRSSRKCLAYDPAVVKLSGKLISRTYPGPPEYESIRKGDRPETYWLLTLGSPVCVNQDTVDADTDPAQKGIRRIQLVFASEKDYQRYRRLLRRRVVATGTLYGATTIHHKTPILLWVQSLTLEK